MQEFVAKHEGDWRLIDDLRLAGMVVGTVTVPAGVTLVMTGSVIGDLIVERGAHAVVDGTVKGAVENRGAWSK
jgi:cytoskeletal protein CcmA (bactofilin family)